MSTRVLVLTPIYPWAPNPHDAVFVRQQVRNLAAAGLTCEVLAFRYSPPGVPAALWRLRHLQQRQLRDEAAGFPVHNVFVTRPIEKHADVIPRVGRALIQHLERHPALSRVDVVYAQWLWPGGAAALCLRRRFGWPVVAIARGGEMHGWQAAHRHCRSYLERVVREGDRVLANCVALQDEVRRLDPDPGKSIDVVYNGCDAERFAPATDREAVRARLGFRPGAQVMLFCGSVIERKGIRTLLRAWEQFAAKAVDWQLVVLGRLVDPKLVRMLGRAGRVRIAGPVPHEQVPGWMQAADAYVQPSIHEGLPNATMEAMATGLPVVATRVDGQRELIADGDSGLLVPVEDPQALAAAFASIAGDPRRAREMGARARNTIIEHFSPPAQAARLASLLRETASARRTAAYGAVVPSPHVDRNETPVCYARSRRAH